MSSPKIIYVCEYYKGRNVKNFVEYIAKREGVDTSINSGFIGYLDKRPHSHGLFSSANIPPSLSGTKNAIAKHNGKIYSSVISLRRKDAERLGYNNAIAWKNLITSKQVEIAKNHKISLNDLRWCAAFHNEGHHPHAHILVWSASPRNERLTNQSIDNLRSTFANEIFKDELLQLYEDKTWIRNKLKSRLKKTLAELNFKANPHIENMMLELRRKLLETSGKKQYGYLKPTLKRLVDKIVQELSKDENIAKLYENWCDLQKEIIGIYREANELPQLWEQKEFVSIKNVIVCEVLKLKEPKHEQSMSAALQNVFFILSSTISDDYERKFSKWSKNLDAKDYEKLVKKKIAMGQKLE
jgi:hypothetical protein